MSKELTPQQLAADETLMAKLSAALTAEAEAQADNVQLLGELSAWRERAELAEAEVKRCEDRLNIDPGGSDRIDELELACDMLRERAEKAEAALAKAYVDAWEHDYSAAPEAEIWNAARIAKTRAVGRREDERVCRRAGRLEAYRRALAWIRAGRSLTMPPKLAESAMALAEAIQRAEKAEAALAAREPMLDEILAGLPPEWALRRLDRASLTPGREYGCVVENGPRAFPVEVSGYGPTRIAALLAACRQVPGYREPQGGQP